MRLVFFLLRLFYIFPLFRHRLTTQGSFLFVYLIRRCYSFPHSVFPTVSIWKKRSFFGTTFSRLTSDVFLSFFHVLLRFSLIFRLISVFGFQGTSWLKLALLPLTVLSVIKKHTWSALWSPVKLLSWLSFSSFLVLPAAHFCEWRRRDSNSWPPACKAGALPTELRPHNKPSLMFFHWDAAYDAITVFPLVCFRWA